MTYVIPPGFSRVSFTYAPVSPAGSAITWGFGCAVSPSAAIIAELMDWYEDNYVPVCNEDYVLRRMEMRNDTLVQEIVRELPGTEDAPMPAPGTSALISLSTGLPGRTNRGRVYWPGVTPEDRMNNAGQMFDAQRTLLGETFESLETYLDSVSAPLVVLHSSVSDPTPVTSWTVQQLTATQRRRLRR